MLRQQPRVPQNCPSNFQGHYTVVPGDTFYIIAQIFRVRIETLAANNPHIPNPSVLFPGDVLCVPGFISYPCCTILSSRTNLPFGTNAVVTVNFAPRGGQAVSFMATLPKPSYFGNYDRYNGEILIPGMGGFSSQLFANSQDPPVWSTRIDLPTAASVMPNSILMIRPSNSVTLDFGAAVLQGTISNKNCQSPA